MRIAIFSDSWYPYLSGVVRSIEIFKNELKRQSHRVFLFAPSSSRSAEEKGDIYRFFSLRAPSNPDFRLALPFSPRIGRLLKELSIDIVHCHSPFMMGKAGMFWGRRLDLPLVFTHHTLYDLYCHYAGPLARPAAWCLNSYVRFFANRCDLVITPTEVVAGQLTARGIKTPLQSVPTGVVLEEFQQGDKTWLRRNLGLGKEGPLLLCVARLGLEKNLFLLLDSFKMVQKHFPQAHLVLVGIGPLRGKLRHYAHRLGIAARFHLLDRILSRKELAGCYNSADLFLYPSVTETQGIIVNEAQAAGLPVVAVGANGIAEMVEDNVDGILTKPEAAALAEAAVKVLADESLRTRLGQKALEAARRITAEEMTERLLQAYEQTINGKSLAVGHNRTLSV